MNCSGNFYLFYNLFPYFSITYSFFVLNSGKMGNGLINMQERAKIIGGSLEINSNINIGTVIKLVCKI